jgi:CRISPR system Cascade subunit CasB
MYRHVIPWIPQNQFLEDAAYTVASLFGLHPESGGTRTIGGALGAIRTNDSNSPPESIERRFITLLSAHEDDLPVQLRQAISLLKTHDIPLDWRRLIRDIQGWTHPDRYVQKRWARDFWTRGQTTGTPTERPEDPNDASTPAEE